MISIQAVKYVCMILVFESFLCAQMELDNDL